MSNSTNNRVQVSFNTDPDSPDVSRLEKEIDEMVYELYDLTPEEIAIVEGKGKV